MIPLRVGDKIKFAEERQRYTVQACNERFAVCTKPFNLHRTVLYTIVDQDLDIRGPENLILGEGAETREQCQAMLVRLTTPQHWGEPTHVSSRNSIPLVIERVWTHD